MIKLLLAAAVGWGAAWLWREWRARQRFRQAWRRLDAVQAYLDTVQAYLDRVEAQAQTVAPP